MIRILSLSGAVALVKKTWACQLEPPQFFISTVSFSPVREFSQISLQVFYLFRRLESQVFCALLLYLVVVVVVVGTGCN